MYHFWCSVLRVQSYFKNLSDALLVVMAKVICKICLDPLWRLGHVTQTDLPEHHVEVCMVVRLNCGHFFHRRCLAGVGSICFECGLLPKTCELITHYKTRNRDSYPNPSTVKRLNNKDCTICLEPWNLFKPRPCDSRFRYVKVRSVIRLDCGHTFHARCFERWFDENPLCPNCRRDWGEYASVRNEISSIMFEDFRCIL